MFKKWIEHKLYRIRTYGYLDAFVLEPWEDMVTIPIQRIIKVIQWIPKLWKIQDWEGIDALLVLDYQLSRTQKVLRNDKLHHDEKTNELTGPILAEQIQEVRDCIKRIKENEYCKEELEKYHENFGDLGIIKNVDPRQNSNEAIKSRDRIFKLMDKRENADYDKLFNDLRKNIQRWWS